MVLDLRWVGKVRSLTRAGKLKGSLSAFIFAWEILSRSVREANLGDYTMRQTFVEMLLLGERSSIVELTFSGRWKRLFEQKNVPA